MGNVCECPENIFHENDLIVDKKSNKHYSSTEVEEVRGLINKQVSKSRFGNHLKQTLSIDQGIVMSINNTQESNLNESVKHSRKSSWLSKNIIIIVYITKYTIIPNK